MGSQYRSVVLRSFSVPVALFLVLPLAVPLVFGQHTIESLVGVLGMLFALVAPLFAVGLLLAPWAGRQLPGRKGPAFAMAVAAALASAAALAVLAAFSGSGLFSLGLAGWFAFFAVPASLVGALLFVGGCERVQLAGSPERPSA